MIQYESIRGIFLEEKEVVSGHFRTSDLQVKSMSYQKLIPMSSNNRLEVYFDLFKSNKFQKVKMGSDDQTVFTFSTFSYFKVLRLRVFKKWTTSESGRMTFSFD